MQTVQRIHLYKTQIPAPADCCGQTPYIMRFGETPSRGRGFLRLVPAIDTPKQTVYDQIMGAMPALRANKLSAGPYNDKDGVVFNFTKAVVAGANPTDLGEVIERLIDTRPIPMIDIQPGIRVADTQLEYTYPRAFDSGYQFMLDTEFVVPDVLTSAGEILTQPKRRSMDTSTGSEVIMQTHIIEPYMLAVAVLRNLGYDAYPAQAVIGNDLHTVRFHPLIAVIDFSLENPLVTFDLLRFHPPMGSVDILSDVAMLGATYTALAEARVNHLTTEMLLQHQEGRELETDEFVNQLNRIAQALYEAHIRWPGCHYINNTLMYAFQDFANAVYAISQANLGNMMMEAERTGQLLDFDPQAALQHLAAEAKDTAGTFVEHIRTMLAQYIRTESTE